VISLVVSSCSGESSGENTIIQGKFSEFPGRKLMINEVEVKTFTAIDTIKVDDDGEFKYSLNIDEAGMYQLKFDNRNYLTLIIHPGENVFVHSDHEKITRKYDVSGSEDSEILNAFEVQMHEKRLLLETKYSDIPSLQRGNNPLLEDHNQKVLFDSLLREHREYVLGQIDRNPASLANLLMVNQRFGIVKVFDQKDDFELFVKLDSALIHKYPDNKHVLDHHRKMRQVAHILEMEAQSNKRLTSGQIIPDVNLEDANGNEMALSAITGKTVLVYFWSSAEPECRLANVTLVDIYSEYKSKGLEVYAVSLDAYKDMWKSAIKNDNLSWINVNESSESAVAFLYQLPGKLPYFYLVDEQQKIITRTGDLEIIQMEIEHTLSR
jgi:peroxiredoxin